MFSRLLTTTRVLVTLVLLFIFLLIVKLNSLTSNDKWYHHPVTKCNHTRDELDDLIEVTKRTHILLGKQRIDHILCYGALFGALRQESILPWDHDVDFCIISDDLEYIEEGYLIRLFKFEGIDLKYDMQEGVYHATYKSARSDLVVFEYSEDYQWIRRIGIKHRLHSEAKRQQFPSRLMAPPLPTKKLNGLELPVPREDMELQKHLYPRDYWKEVKPPNC